MKILFLQDLNPWATGGGAQLTDRNILVEGIRRGHNIVVITPDSPIEAYELAIFSNCVTFPMTTLLKIAQKPYIMWTHDYYFCRYRLYYPMLPKCRNCVYIGPWRKLYSESVLNFFMSPLHREGYLYAMPEIANHPYALVPSAINPSDYQPIKQVNPKPNTVVGVNVLLDFKGKANVIKYAQEHPELSFTFAGGLEGEATLPRNSKYIGPKSQQELVQLYAESECLIHLPSQPSPADRVPVEFLIANPNGKLITNRNVGILSYPNVIQDGKVNRDELSRLVSTAPQTFWNDVEASWEELEISRKNRKVKG
jgi:hypothetical protein